MNNLALIWAYWAYLALSWADMVFKGFKVSNFPRKSLFSFHSVPGRAQRPGEQSEKETHKSHLNLTSRPGLDPICSIDGFPSTDKLWDH